MKQHIDVHLTAHGMTRDELMFIKDMVRQTLKDEGFDMSMG